MRQRFIHCAAITSGAAFVAAATAMAGPGPVYRPAAGTPMPRTTPAPAHVVVATANTLPGARYVWAQPVFVRTSKGVFLIPRTPVA